VQFQQLPKYFRIRLLLDRSFDFKAICGNYTLAGEAEQWENNSRNPNSMDVTIDTKEPLKQPVFSLRRLANGQASRWSYMADLTWNWRHP
jgi:hypothetical protein